MLSKTHQGNWSKNVISRFENIMKNFEDSGDTEFRDLSF